MIKAVQPPAKITALTPAVRIDVKANIIETIVDPVSIIFTTSIVQK